MLKNQKGIGLVYVLLIVLAVAAIGTGAYFFGTKNTPIVSQAPNPTLSPSAIPSPTTGPSTSPSPSPTINPTLLENIKASVISKNTAALEGYMTDTVNVIIEATECCGNITKVNAIKEMDYLNTATEPWNFDDNNPIALQLKQKNPQTFPAGAIIGTSANKMLVTFTLNQDKTKIEKLYMAVDYKLLGI